MRRPPARAVAAADALLARLGVRAPDELDIERIAASCGLVVIEGALAAEEGHVVRAGGLGIVRVARSSMDSAKWRFTIAHELGHHLLHADLDDFGRCVGEGAGTPRHEIAANAFAAALLMPAGMFLASRRSARPTWDELAELASLFRTSLTSTALRFLELTDEPLAVVHATAGTIGWRATTRAFAARIAKDAPVPAGTRAHALSGGEASDEAPHAVSAKLWDPEARVDGLIEHAWRLEPHGAVVSLLAHASA